jgi:vacuolar-type H+-ATPase catalytic subunit A/Vma1
LQLQFDKYDTTKDNDYITIERVTKNLDQLEKQDRIRAVDEMKKQTQKESKKSLIGRINAEEMKSEDKRVNSKLEKVGRENHVGENFFNLDPTSTKLKKADWLELVCF